MYFERENAGPSMNTISLASRKNLPIILGIAILSLFVIRTALIPGCTWETHDLIFNMERFAAASNAMADGQWFPRWSRDINSGYGYPLLLFYPPLTVWFVAGLHLAGIGILTGTKLLVALCTVLAAVTAWQLGRHLWHDRLSAALTAACYILLPYHLLTVMVRGALAEYAAHALLPAVLLAYLKLPGAKPARSIASTAVLSALLMLTHNASWIIITPLCIGITFAVESGKIRRLAATSIATLLGLAISAFYWLPAYVEKSFVAISNLGTCGHLDYHRHFSSLEKIFSERWGYDGIGIPLSILWICAVSAIISRRLRSFPDRRTVILLLIAVPAVILLTLPPAAFIWDHIAIIQYIQFPWRLTAVAGLCAAAAAPAALCLFPGPYLKGVAATAAAVALLAVSPLQTDRPIQRFDDRPGLSLRHLRTSGTTTVVGDEYRPLTVKTPPETSFGPRQDALTPGDPCAVVIPFEDRSGRIGAYIVCDRPQTLRVNCLYFPGWTGTVDDTPADIYPDNSSGLIMIDLPDGDHRLDLTFVDTPIRTAGTIISILSFLILIAMVIPGSRWNPIWRFYHDQ